MYNGTNFVGAERELQLVDDFNCDHIVKETNKQYRIEWKFNPPAAPHFRGVFEAMIKAAKRALRSIQGNADVTYEELHSYLWRRNFTKFQTHHLCQRRH